MRYSALHSALLLVAATVLGCGGGGGSGAGVVPTVPATPTTPTTPTAPAGSVTVGLSSFSPATVTVPASSTVTWAWNSCSGNDSYGTGTTCVTHNIVFDDGAAGSGAMSSGSFTRTFTAAGTYPYHCSIHGAAMSGKVVVQ